MRAVSSVYPPPLNGLALSASINDIIIALKAILFNDVDELVQDG